MLTPGGTPLICVACLFGFDASGPKFGPQAVRFTLCSGYPSAQLITGFFDRYNPGLICGPQFVSLTGGVLAGLIELALEVGPCPFRFGPGGGLG